MNETKPQVVIYSVLVGNYDNPPMIPKVPGVRRVLFSDRPRPDVSATGAEVVMLQGDVSTPEAMRRTSRRPKILAHQYLGEHSLSIYMDANLRFKRSPMKWAREQLGDADMAVWPHPNPNSQTLQDHVSIVVKFRLDYEEAVRTHYQRLLEAGVPENAPVTENCFLVRRNNARVQQFNEAWWDDYSAGSCRDQISFAATRFFMPDVRTNLIQGRGDSRKNDFYEMDAHLLDHAIVPPPKEERPLPVLTGKDELLRECARVCAKTYRILQQVEPKMRTRQAWVGMQGAQTMKALRHLNTQLDEYRKIDARELRELTRAAGLVCPRS